MSREEIKDLILNIIIEENGEILEEKKKAILSKLDNTTHDELYRFADAIQRFGYNAICEAIGG